jgi:hypothetical protein
MAERNRKKSAWEPVLCPLGQHLYSQQTEPLFSDPINPVSKSCQLVAYALEFESAAAL